MAYELTDHVPPRNATEPKGTISRRGRILAYYRCLEERQALLAALQHVQDPPLPRRNGHSLLRPEVRTVRQWRSNLIENLFVTT